MAKKRKKPTKAELEEKFTIDPNLTFDDLLRASVLKKKEDDEDEED